MAIDFNEIVFTLMHFSDLSKLMIFRNFYFPKNN